MKEPATLMPGAKVMSAGTSEESLDGEVLLTLVMLDLRRVISSVILRFYTHWRRGVVVEV